MENFVCYRYEQQITNIIDIINEIDIMRYKYKYEIKHEGATS